MGEGSSRSCNNRAVVATYNMQGGGLRHIRFHLSGPKAYCRKRINRKHLIPHLLWLDTGLLPNPLFPVENVLPINQNLGRFVSIWGCMELTHPISYH